MNTKTQQIRNAVAKIDIDKINGYLKEHPKSKTLKQIIGYRKGILFEDYRTDEEIFKWGVRIAYLLDTIVNISKYVKNEEEKKALLAVSRELFESTIGVKE